MVGESQHPVAENRARRRVPGWPLPPRAMRRPSNCLFLLVDHRCFHDNRQNAPIPPPRLRILTDSESRSAGRHGEPQGRFWRIPLHHQQKVRLSRAPTRVRVPPET